nr:MAG TPA: hypothetical protein [Caudoviricetes sp.]
MLVMMVVRQGATIEQAAKIMEIVTVKSTE